MTSGYHPIDCGLHDELQLVFDLPRYYGRNLDALWDVLTTDVALPVTVIWENYRASRENLGSYAGKVKGVFLEAAEQLKGFTFETA